MTGMATGCLRMEYSIQVFLWKVIRQDGTEVTSLCMQFEKAGRGLLWEAFQSKGVCVVNQKRGGI